MEVLQLIVFGIKLSLEKISVKRFNIKVTLTSYSGCLLQCNKEL